MITYRIRDTKASLIDNISIIINEADKLILDYKVSPHDKLDSKEDIKLTFKSKNDLTLFKMKYNL